MLREIAVVGGGKVGTALGYLLSKRGFEITAVFCRSLDKARASQIYTGGLATADMIEAARSARTVFICTRDDEIEKTCQTISRGEGFQKGGSVFHFSGALSIQCLAAAKEKGAFIGSIHPLQSFATVEDAISHIPGSFFGVTACKDALPLARSIVKALDGRYLEVKDEDRPAYHAAACIASNYLVSLIHFAVGVASTIGISREQAGEALWPLIEGTLDNIASEGPVKALTGPISRGDVGTLKMHLGKLRAASAEELSLYTELGRYTAKLALEKGSIDHRQHRAVARLFSRRARERRKNCG